MKKLKELVQLGTDKDVTENLIQCSNRMQKLALDMPIYPTEDYIGLVATRILNYVAAETDAAAQVVGKDIKHFAWRTRNILEAFLLFKHSTSSQEIAKKFTSQRIADEVTILDGMLTLSPELSGNDITIIKERSKTLSKVLENHSISNASPWRVDQLAKAVGMQDDYSAFYKLYSKYVHPSGWVIVADANEYNNQDYWQVFKLNAQLYSHYCCGAGEELVSSRKATLH